MRFENKIRIEIRGLDNIGLDVDYSSLHAGAGLLQQFCGKLPEVLPVDGDAYHLPQEDGTVDCVLSRGLLYYLQKYKTFGEMVRVLRTGGYLVVTVPTINFMTRRVWDGVKTFRLRQTIRYALAVLLGIIAWSGFDVRPWHGLFIGETLKGMRARVAAEPGLRVIRLERISLPFLGNPILLVAEKVDE